tara:strand:- start:22611 stop:23168 length:558 start_codon:yes stop_codon:yes gene_type:complete
MKKWVLAGVLAGAILPVQVKKAHAYDMDCAIMLCMAGGFPPSAVCAAAFRTMIRRITPWPSRPPFGICTYAAIPVELGGPGGEADLDISTSEYAWLRRTRVIWWYGNRSEDRDGDTRYSWSIKSCDGENRNCRYIERKYGSHSRWPASFISGNDQLLTTFGEGRAIMMEYSDFEGTMDHSEWFRY